MFLIALCPGQPRLVSVALEGSWCLLIPSWPCSRWFGADVPPPPRSLWRFLKSPMFYNQDKRSQGSYMICWGFQKVSSGSLAPDGLLTTPQWPLGVLVASLGSKACAHCYWGVVRDADHSKAWGVCCGGGSVSPSEPRLLICKRKGWTWCF